MKVELDGLIIGFIGGGSMASAIIDGMLRKGLVKSSQIIVSCLSESTLEKWKKLNVTATHSNESVIKKSHVIFLAFKPYQLESALSFSGTPYSDSKLFISILAGISGDAIYNKVHEINPTCRVIRVMPNTPLLVGEGCSAISSHSSAEVEDVEFVKTIFAALGKCEVVAESQMDVATGLVGSGPAFVYMMIEALSDGAVKQGLPRDLATVFAAQTVLGSAKMVLETKEHPGALKDRVCSAGGTTIHGLHALEKGGLRAALMDGIEAAVLRSKALGGKPNAK